MELLRRWKEHRKVTRALLKVPAPGKYISIPRLSESHVKKFGNKTVTVYKDDVNNKTYVNKVPNRLNLWETFDPVDGVTQATEITDGKHADKNFWWREEFSPDTIIDVTKLKGIADEEFHGNYEDNAWEVKWDTDLKAVFYSFNRNVFILSENSGSILHQPAKCDHIVVKSQTTRQAFWAGVLSRHAPAINDIVQGPSRAILTPFLCLRNVTSDFKNLRYELFPTNNWNPYCLLQLLTRSAEEQRSVVKPDVGHDQQSLVTKRCDAICLSLERSPKSTGCLYDEGHATWREHVLEMPWKLFVTNEIYERLGIPNIPNQGTMNTTSALCGYFSTKCFHLLLKVFPIGFLTTLQIQTGNRLHGPKKQLTQTILTLDQTTKGVHFTKISEKSFVTEESSDLLQAPQKTEAMASETTVTIKRSKPRRKGFIARMWRGLRKIWTRRRTSE